MANVKTALLNEAYMQNLMNTRRYVPTDTAELDYQYSRLYGNMRRRIKNIDRATGGSTGATYMKDLLDEIPTPAEAKSLTNRSKVTAIREMYKKTQNFGATVKTARQQLQQGVDMFGDEYAKWDADQRTAAWEEFHRLQEEWGIASLTSYNIFKTIDNTGNKLHVDFRERKDGSLRASIGMSEQEARSKGDVNEAEDAVLAKLLADSAPMPEGDLTFSPIRINNHKVYQDSDSSNSDGSIRTNDRKPYQGPRV